MDNVSNFNPSAQQPYAAPAHDSSPTSQNISPSEQEKRLLEMERQIEELREIIKAQNEANAQTNPPAPLKNAVLLTPLAQSPKNDENLPSLVDLPPLVEEPSNEDSTENSLCTSPSSHLEHTPPPSPTIHWASEAPSHRLPPIPVESQHSRHLAASTSCSSLPSTTPFSVIHLHKISLLQEELRRQTEEQFACHEKLIKVIDRYWQAKSAIRYWPENSPIRPLPATDNHNRLTQNHAVQQQPQHYRAVQQQPQHYHAVQQQHQPQHYHAFWQEQTGPFEIDHLATISNQRKTLKPAFTQQPQRNFLVDPSEQTQRNFLVDPSKQTQRNFLVDPSEQTQRNFLVDPSEQTQRNFLVDLPKQPEPLILAPTQQEPLLPFNPGASSSTVQSRLSFNAAVIAPIQCFSAAIQSRHSFSAAVTQPVQSLTHSRQTELPGILNTERTSRSDTEGSWRRSEETQAGNSQGSRRNLAHNVHKEPKEPKGRPY